MGRDPALPGGERIGQAAAAAMDIPAACVAGTDVKGSVGRSVCISGALPRLFRADGIVAVRQGSARQSLIIFAGDEIVMALIERRHGFVIAHDHDGLEFPVIYEFHSIRLLGF